MPPGASRGPCARNGIPYRGINVLMLWAAAIEQGYAAPIWMTFKQAQELGAQVQQGREGQPCRLRQHHHPHRDRTRRPARSIEREIPFMKGYTVFNVEQIEGLPAHFYAMAAAARLIRSQRIEHAEAFFAATGADIRARRQSGLLQHGRGPRADAAL